MNVHKFIKRRAIIERRYAGRAWKKRRAAMDRLVREAGAAVIIIKGRLIGWQLPDGKTVCVKTRYRDQGSADDDLQRIRALNLTGKHVPIRAYACDRCKGWHLTSQPPHRKS